MDAAQQARDEIKGLDEKLTESIANAKHRHRDELKRIRDSITRAKREWQNVIKLNEQIENAKRITPK